MKKLLLMHGVSGSGKSSLAKKLIREYIKTEEEDPAFELNWNDGDIIPYHVVLSTDDIVSCPFGNPSYLWSPHYIGLAHTLNKEKCCEAMRRQIPLIIIDNTNLTWKEIKPYAELALQANYDVEIVEPSTDWRNDAKTCFQQSTHGVPMETIEKMIKKKESVESLRQKLAELSVGVE